MRFTSGRLSGLKRFDFRCVILLLGCLASCARVPTALPHRDPAPAQEPLPIRESRSSEKPADKGGSFEETDLGPTDYDPGNGNKAALRYTPPVQDKPGPELRLYNFGIYSALTDHQVMAKKSSEGRISLVTDIRQISRTEIVPAALGTRFGVEFVLEGEPEGQRGRVEVRVIHPEIVDPRIGKTATIDQWVMFPRIGQPTYAGWEFSHEWELVTGEWRIEIWRDDNKGLEKTFRVQSASSGFVYLIQTDAFQNEPNARRAMNMLRENGYSACIIALRDDNGADWYTVFIGWSKDPTEADRVRKEFHKQTRKSAILHKLKEELFVKLRGRCL